MYELLTIFVNMRIVNIRILQKHLKKNKGNNKLHSEINKLISTIEMANWKNPTQIKKARPDADRVHPEGFYFFNIAVDRTMILIELDEEEATIVWCGNHNEYISTFKNNKSTIKKWLQSKQWI